MSEILAVVLLVVVVLAVRNLGRQMRRAASESLRQQPPSVSLSVSSSESSVLIPNTGPVKAVGETGWWLLNPDGGAPVTVTGVDRSTADEMKRLLDRGYREPAYQHTRELTAFLLRTNARWVELEDYIERARGLYQRAIADQQHASTEWQTAGERDREDLRAEFQRAAIQTLDVRPFADLTVLLEDVPTDATLDDLLLQQYGFDALRLYLRYVRPRNPVRNVPADSRERGGFENLVKVGLARRGTDIPIQDILETCTLKEMNEMVSDPALPPFRRKRVAIDHLVALPDSQARLGRQLAFRELFQLLPLPEQFAHIDVGKLAQTWRHTHEVADLMQRTYVFGGWAAQQRATVLSMMGKRPLYWRVHPVADDVTCPACRRAGQVGYRQDAMPREPLHPGCRCWVHPEYSDPPASLHLSSTPPCCQLPTVSKVVSHVAMPQKMAAGDTFRIATVHARKQSQEGKARFALPDGFEGTVEEVALHHYEQEGWQGVWGENHLWWMGMVLLFWDVYFAEVEGAWDPYLRQIGLAADMPKDLFRPEFYAKRSRLITDRMAVLRQGDLSAELTAAYKQHYGKPCRVIEGWEKFSLPVLQQMVTCLPKGVVLQVFQRLLENFNEHRRGLPDLLIWKPGLAALAEVKGPGDSLSLPQQEWLKLLGEWGAETWVVHIVDQSM